MIKRLSIVIGSLMVNHFVHAQNDSLHVVQASWKSHKLAKGVYWRTMHVDNNQLFHSNQYVHIIEVAPNAKRARLEVAHSDSLEKTSQLAQRHHALAAINGSFFKMRGADPDHHADLKGVPPKEPAKLGHNRSIVYLREHDSLIASNVPDKDRIRKRHMQGSIAINDRDFFIVKGDSVNLRSEESIVAHDVLSTGPVMLLNGQPQTIPNDAFCNDRHPRTAMGEKPDGTIVLLVVDGRAKEAAGMSIPELQQLMKWLGCRDAINLDGGGSSTLFIKGQPYNGVVNYPTDNKQFDHEGEREVANVIVITQH